MTIAILPEYTEAHLERLESLAGHSADYPMLLAWTAAAEESGYGSGVRSLAVQDGEPVAAAQGLLRRQLGVHKLQCGSTSGSGIIWRSGSEDAAARCVEDLIRRTRPSLTNVFSSKSLRIGGVTWEPAYTFRVDLHLSLADLLGRMAPEARRKIRRAEKLGVRAEGRTDDAALEEAYSVISSSAQSRRFPDLPRRYSMALHRNFDHEGFQGCVVAHLDGRPVSAATFLGSSGTALWWKGGSTEEGYRASAGNLVQSTAVAWLKERRVVTYDLGGTHPNKPEYAGIHEFKASLGGVLVETSAGARTTRFGRFASRLRRFIP